MPSNIVVTASLMFLKYRATPFFAMLNSLDRWTVIQFGLGAPQVESHSPEELHENHCRQEHHAVLHHSVPVWPNDQPYCRPDQVHEANWHQVLPAQDHELVHPYPWQGRTHPHGDKDPEVRLQEEH